MVMPTFSVPKKTSLISVRPVRRKIMMVATVARHSLLTFTCLTRFPLNRCHDSDNVWTRCMLWCTSVTVRETVHPILQRHFSLPVIPCCSLPFVCYVSLFLCNRMGEQFAFFKDGLSDRAFVKYMDLIQDEVATYFTKQWGEEGQADLLQSLSDLFTLTSSRCLLGEEIRKRWEDSGMAEHYCKLLLPFWKWRYIDQVQWLTVTFAVALDHSFVPILFFFPNMYVETSV